MNKAETQTQTLDVLVGEVLDKNPELKFYEAEIAAAKGGYKSAGVLPNPEVEGAVGQKRVWDDEGTLSDKGEAYSVEIIQRFEWPGKIALRKSIADKEVQISELGLRQFRAELAARARILAFGYLAAQQKAATAREVAERFHEVREVMVQRDPAGLTPLLETRVIEATELNMHRKAGEAQLAKQAILFELNRLRDAPPGAPLVLENENPEFEPLQNQDALLESARSQDFAVRVKAIELAQQGFRVTLAQNEVLPDISVGPSFSQEGTGGRERIVGAVVSMPFPLWNRNEGAIEASKARQIQAEASLYAAQREAEQRAAEAASIYETKLQEMAHWPSDSIQHFKEAAELADRHYRLGAVPITIYIELQQQYQEAVGGLEDTKTETVEAAEKLALLTGRSFLLNGVVRKEN